MTGEDLEAEDLIELKTSRIQRPRPPTLTSIPSLLSSLQNEWDAIALETFELQKQLAQTRQELTLALYQNDAANRVIARLMSERDEARDTLSKISVSGGGGGAAAAANGDAMQVDGQGLPAEIAAKVDAVQNKYVQVSFISCVLLNWSTYLTHHRLMSTRRKRPIPEDWATADAIGAFDSVQKTEALYPGSQTLALNSDGDLAIIGSEGAAGVYSLSQKEVVHAIKVSETVTSAVWWDGKAIISTSTGDVKVYDGDQEVADLGSHAGAVKTLCLHPSGDILASIGTDKSYKLYDLTSSTAISQVHTEPGKFKPAIEMETLHTAQKANVCTALTCGSFHPDGHLIAAGTEQGQIKLWETKSGTDVATFDVDGPIQAICFSENGTWLAAVVRGQSVVSIWDLRKSNIIKTLEVGSAVESLAWDYTGQFLAIAGSGSVSVQQYAKSSKSWTEVVKKAALGKVVQWGPQAQSLVLLTTEGGLDVFGSA